MKIRLPQALIRTLTAAAVFVTPLATTVATGSFFASTASAALEVVREGGNFVLERSQTTGDNGTVYTFTEKGGMYTGLWSFDAKTGQLTFTQQDGGNALLDALKKNHGFTVGLSIGDTALGYETLVTLGTGGPEFGVEVEVVEKTKPKPSTVITKYLYVLPVGEDDDLDVTTFNSSTSTLGISWTGSALTGSIDGSSVSCAASGLDDITNVTLNSNYVTSFTINIAATNTVKYGDGLSHDYGTGTVLENSLGNAAAIVLSDSETYTVTNSTNLSAVTNADVYIGGDAQLKLSATTLSQDLSGGNKTIYIDGGKTDAALVLSADSSDSRGRIYLGKVELVSDATIDVADGTNEKVTLLDALNGTGKNLTIKSSGASNENGLTLGRSGSKSGTISVASLTLDDASLYLNGGSATAGSATAGAVKVERNGSNGSLTSITMDDNGLIGATGASASNAKVTVGGVNKVVSDVDVKGSTITFSGTGATVSKVNADGSQIELKDGSIADSSVKNTTVTAEDKATVSNTDVTDGSVITLKGAGSSISDGAVTGSTITFSGTGATVSKVNADGSQIELKDGAVTDSSVKNTTVTAEDKVTISNTDVTGGSVITLNGADSSISGGSVTGSTVTLSGANAGISGATIADGSTVTLSGSNGVISGGSIKGSTIALSGNGSQLGYTAAPVENLPEGEVAAPAPVTRVENSTISLSDGTAIDKNVRVSNSTINVLENATATIGGNLQGDVIALQNACSLTVKDAVLSGSTSFVRAEGDVEASNLKIESSQIWLTSVNTSDITQVSRDGKSGLQFNANLFADLSATSIELSDITLCFTRDLIEALERQHADRFGYKGLHYLEINFANGESTTVELANVDAWYVGGELPTDGYMTWGSPVVDGSVISGVVFLDSPISNIPEPTTATLSALALAALAARRRRKS